MISKISELLFDDEEVHPLDLDKEEHRTKEIELKEKQKQLRSQVDELEKQLDQKKQQYFDQRDKGNEKEAERLQRDAEDIQDELETLQTKLNAVDKMLNTVSNFQNVYELREIGEGQYWERIRSLEQSELVARFSREKKPIEELMNDLEDISITSQNTISSLKTESEDLHSRSTLDWDEEYSEETNEVSESVPDAFSTEVDGSDEVDEFDFNELNLS